MWWFGCKVSRSVFGDFEYYKVNAILCVKNVILSL